MKRLAIITTHPIQYNAPLFKLLFQRANIAIKVFYTWGESVLENKFDPGFGKEIKWDIPLLEGYVYEFVTNKAKSPGSHHYKGIVNPDLVKRILAFNADVILVYGWNFHSHLNCLRYFKGKLPVLFRGDSTLLKQDSILKRIARKIFLKWVYTHVDKALFVGKNNLDYYKAMGLKEQKLVFAPHAVDNERYQKNQEEFETLAKRKRLDLGIPDEAIVFMYAGKFEPTKNLYFLINSFNKLNNDNAYLLLVGDGNLKESLIQQAGANKKIIFLPFQNQQQMPVVYRISDVYVLPSLGETWGLSINEAMACNRAILASERCGAAIDLIKEGKNGFVFKTSLDTDLLNKLELLSADKKRTHLMGLFSGDLISEWSLSNLALVIENTVNEIA